MSEQENGKRRWRVEVSQDDDLPTGYGKAYFDPIMRVYVCYPVPWNRVVHLAYAIWYWLSHAPDGIMHRTWKHGFERGYEAGLVKGAQIEQMYMVGLEAGTQGAKAAREIAYELGVYDERMRAKMERAKMGTLR